MRRNSLYRKLFTFVMAIFIISSILLGTLVFSFLGNYFNEKEEKKLKEIAEEVVDITIVLANAHASGATFSASVNGVAKATGTEIFVVDEKGTVVTSSVNGYEIVLKEKFTKGMLEGKSEVFRGEVNGKNKTNMLAVSLPVRYNDKVVGGVLVSVPVPEIAKARGEVFKYFFWSIIAATAFVAIMVYFLAKKITNPILKLNDAAHAIAKGNFKKRVELEEIEEFEEINELCETFNEMAVSIQEFENTRNSFVANISHDLRTPMTTISGFVQGILDGTIPEEKHEWYLSIVLDESKRLSRIVNDLLDISKLEQGSFNIELKDFDINELTRLNVIKFEKKITDKNIQLTVEFEKDSTVVNADKDAISRVLTNLLDNAIKFTNENGFIDIRVGTKEDKAYVSVQNSGLGIAEEELRHIFDRFYKTDKSRSLDKNGAGLGLYIVKNIISAHGERIWAESQKGEYARFSFTLDLAENKKQNAEEK